MNVLLICPSNNLFMPYVSNYTLILDDLGVEYVLQIWDRFGIEEPSPFVFKDDKVGHARTLRDYLQYRNHVRKVMKRYHFDKVIVFGLSLGFFLSKFLMQHYKERYILDIRDYHKVLNLWNPSKVIADSYATVVSSPMFQTWLPPNHEYFVNHNSAIYRLPDLVQPNVERKKEKVNISYIGSVAHYDINRQLIQALRNSEWCILEFHGQGTASNEIIALVEAEKIENVKVTGIYDKADESSLYSNSDMVNMVLSSDSVNNRTCLPNRLYNACLYGKPLLTNTGTFVSDIIRDYNLGLVLNNFDDVENQIRSYWNEFDEDAWVSGRDCFLQSVVHDNIVFRDKVREFVLTKNR